jgi:hypothetical protein
MLDVMKESDLKARIDELAVTGQQSSGPEAHSMYQGALSVMIALHGENSSQVKNFLRQREQIQEKFLPNDIEIGISTVAEGAIKNLQAEIDAGFAGSLQQTISGEVITDFVRLAHQAMDYDASDNSKNVASVLAAAAFEDTFRRLAKNHNIPHMEKLADLLDELKERKILQGTQVGIANSYLNFRNSALHAQWERIERASVAAVLGFIEQLLLSHF